jgi:hypothetical protein
MIGRISTIFIFMDIRHVDVCKGKGLDENTGVDDPVGLTGMPLQNAQSLEDG